MTLIMYILRLISGADPGFQVSREGGALKWVFFGGISCEKSQFYAISNFRGGRGTSIQKLINIDRRKLVEILVLILKEVIDRFIWTIELCHI